MSGTTKKKILVIDDEWQVRKEVYDNVLSTKFEIDYIKNPDDFFGKTDLDKYSAFLSDIVLANWKTRERKPQEIMPILEKIKPFNKPVFLVSSHFDTLINNNRLTPTLLDVVKKSIPLESLFVYKEFEEESYRRDNPKDSIYVESIMSLIYLKILQYDEEQKKKEAIKADIGIVCALGEELSPIIKKLKNKQVIEGLPASRGTIITKSGREIKVVAVSQDEMGTEDAAILGTLIIKEFKVNHLFMTGVCGGRSNKVKIGDLIIPSEVIAYQRGKIDNGRLLLDVGSMQSNVLNRQIYENNCDIILSEIFDEYIEILKTKGKSLNIETPKIKFDEMACGSNVINDSEEDLLGKISNDVAKRKLSSVDMESYAILRLSKFLNVKCSVMKSVMDLTKDKNDDYKEYACYVSANFLIKVLQDEIYKI